MPRLSRTEQRQRARRNPPEEDPEFQVAPMIDILLVLLVFFMSISSTEVLQANRTIQLPVAADGRSASKNNPGQVIVNVTWTAINNLGSLDVNEQKFAQPSEIVSVLQKAVSANPLVRVLIRADKEVRYDYLRTLLQAVGEAGITNVTFSVVDKEAAK